MEPESASKPAATAVESDTQYFRRILSQVLIQEIATGRYYQAPGVWSLDTTHAVKFRTESTARECVTHLGLTNVQIVMMHQFRECQILPLDKHVRVWSAESASKTQLSPGNLRTPFSVFQILPN